MSTFLLYDDAIRSYELRHEIVEPIMDDIGFIEHEGRRIVVGSVLEGPIFEARDDVIDEFWNIDELGYRDLVNDKSVPVDEIGPELLRRALERLGVSSVVVPPSFKLQVADFLRGRGVEVVVDAETWDLRRRRKNPTEIEGIERAQRAAETAMLTASRMLRSAEPTGDGRLRFEGEILTAELIRIGMQAELIALGAESEEIIVHSGDACLRGHELGSGPILPNQSCIIDCFPRDRRTGAYTDMTRTFVPGEPSPELEKLHAHVREALEIAFEAIVPGTKEAHSKVSEFFASHGYPTFDTHEGPGPLTEGFFHSLGHGVGLQVHERPWIGRRPDEFRPGDVIALEPGLYFEGIGGVRLEDTVLVTEDGVERFTDPFPYDLTPS